MTESIINILVKLAAAFVVLWLAPKAKEWLTGVAGNEAATCLITMCREFVKAADQLYKADDPTGAIRNAYVKEQITKLGVTVTDEINAYIEAAVLELKRGEEK